MTWWLFVIGLFVGTFALMFATGAVLAFLSWVCVKLGNPGKLINEGPRRGRDPGQGYYIEPNDDAGA